MSKEKRKRDQKRKRDRRRERATRSAEEVREPEAAAGEEEPAMSLEEFRQLRDEFFEGIPARIDALKRELVEEMAPSDAFDLLTNLLIANLPMNIETYRESQHQGLIAFVEYAGLLLLERPSRAGTDTERLKPIDARVLPGIESKLREMLTLDSPGEDSLHE